MCASLSLVAHFHRAEARQVAGSWHLDVGSGTLQLLRRNQRDFYHDHQSATWRFPEMGVPPKSFPVLKPLVLGILHLGTAPIFNIWWSPKIGVSPNHPT